MRSTVLSAVGLMVFGIIGSAPAWAQHHHAGDLVVGRTPTGQLQVEFDFDEVHELPAVSGLLVGWALDDPGFDHLEADEPDKDFYMLEDGAQIALEVVSFAPAFKAWTPGFAATLRSTGDTYLFPDGHLLHGHLDWHIDSTDAAFDELQTEWQASFKLLDQGATGYSASDVYTLRFTNVPEPTTAALMAVAVSVLARKRRGAIAPR